MRAAIGSTILIATLAGPLAAQAKAILGVIPDRSKAHDVNARLVAARAARVIAAAQACTATAAAAPAAHLPAWPAPVQIAAPASSMVATEAMLAAEIHRHRPVVLRL